ncbi:uncharacterized protein BT62DRAFT_924435 [Guyanagaster necrorhizus]|uniref:Uncharacterized protein n=1 Tax=Guyanagaster necrorhizus TaxID=856835 RepID=A0A9P8ALJ0_9AGAR|nr:uncharacterized protein BT62DRAFT_924435 [Guyanagaster necrorhizus MCA 3950]KAG7439850.1 hypothetical protein BT62DRAFT_924435 [Guyanagaster necrorhizus MCA 3950]
MQHELLVSESYMWFWQCLEKLSDGCEDNMQRKQISFMFLGMKQDKSSLYTTYTTFLLILTFVTGVLAYLFDIPYEYLTKNRVLWYLAMSIVLIKIESSYTVKVNGKSLQD